MLKYVLKRILFFVPTLLLISLLAFAISINTPGDAVERILNSTQGSTEQSATSADRMEQVKIWKHRLGLDLPLFYFSIHSKVVDDSLNKILDKEEKENAERKILAAAGWQKFIPILSFHFPNQYHRWLFGDGENSQGIVRGDFGISIISQQKISNILAQKLPWTLFFSLVSIFIAYGISIPLGVFFAKNKNSKWQKLSSFFVFALPALPSFFVATLLLMTFSNTTVLHWFPSSGIAPVEGFSTSASIFEKIKITLPYLILPIICFSYSSIAYLSRMMRVSILESMQSDFITTARAKGLTENKIYWRHAFHNSLLPIITTFAQIFPMAIGGSVIIETIFTLPGMGREIYLAIGNRDYSLIVAVFTLSGFLTLVGYLISDILYALADPRIVFSKK